MEMSGQFHTPVAVYPGRDFSLPAVRAQQPAGFFGEKLSASTENRINLRRLSSPYLSHYTCFTIPNHRGCRT